MKIFKLKIILILGFFIVSSLFCFNFINDEIGPQKEMNKEEDIDIKDVKNLEISDFWTNFSFIHIKDNWTQAKTWGWVSGDGTWNSPYILENITIDATNSLIGCGILIEESKNDYFIIRNCTVLNSSKGQNEDYNAGIKLKKTHNGTIYNNTCKDDNYIGIYLYYTCSNNSIFNNILINNYHGIWLNGVGENRVYNNTVINNEHGIGVSNSDSNNVTSNIIKNNHWGLSILGNNNNASRNILTNCGIIPNSNIQSALTNSIDTTNLVNGNPLYIYINKISLGFENYSDAGQVVLLNCSNSIVSNLNISKIGLSEAHSSFVGYGGIVVAKCKNVTVMNNNVSICCDQAIYIWDSDNISVSENIGSDNFRFIEIDNSNNSLIANNTALNCFWAICADDAYNNTFWNNSIIDSESYGMLIDECVNNTFSNNSFINTYMFGIWLLECENITFIYNYFYHTDGFGVYLESTNNSLIANNIFIQWPPCVYEVNCHGNDIRDNICCYNGGTNNGEDDGDNGDNDDDNTEIAISFGNAFIIFTLLGIIWLFFLRKHQISHKL
jgi:parallel beta-helix repeat protein